MDGIYVVSQRKYRVMTGAAIVLPIITGILLAAFVYVVLWLAALSKPYFPNDGRWYCEELGLEVCFDGGVEPLAIDRNGEEYLTKRQHRDDTLYVYEIAGIYPEDDENHTVKLGAVIGDQIYEYGDLVYELDSIKLNKDSFKVRDKAGNEYVFVRKEE